MVKNGHHSELRPNRTYVFPRFAADGCLFSPVTYFLLHLHLLSRIMIMSLNRWLLSNSTQVFIVLEHSVVKEVLLR